jgi:hypothetical protein
MPRLLTFAEQQVAAATRAEYLAGVAARRLVAASAGANFWVFEHVDQQGRFVEFTEGGSEAAVRAVNGEPDHGTASLALWREVRGE